MIFKENIFSKHAINMSLHGKFGMGKFIDEKMCNY